MKTRYIFYLLSFLTLVLSLTIGGCSSGGSSVSSTTSTTLISSTISPEGGILDAEEINISIPANTFDREIDISIIKVSQDQNVYYEIVGLPEILNKDITVSFPVDIDEEGESLLVYGEKEQCFSPSLNAHVDCISLIEGNTTEGYFSAVIPANIDVFPLSSSNRSLEDDFNSVLRTMQIQRSFMIRTADSGRYKIFVKIPVENTSVTDFMFDALDSFYLDLYLSDLPVDDIKKPFPIYVLTSDIDPNLLTNKGYVLPSLTDRFKTKMIIQENSYLEAYSLEGRGGLKGLLQHEFFHSAQLASLKDNLAYQSYIDDPEKLLWLMEASSTSIEHYTLEDPTTSIPLIENDFKNFPVYGIGADFNQSGLWLPTISDSTKMLRETGYGMGLFFYYLSSQYASPSIIYNIWSQQISNDTNSLKALEDTVVSYLNSSLSEEWLKFFKVYFSGKMQLYGWPLFSSSKTYDTASEENFSKVFTMPAYSSLYIDINNTTEENSLFYFLLSNANSTRLLLYDDSGTIIKTSSGESEDEFSIPPGKSYRLALVTAEQKEELTLIISDKVEDNTTLPDGVVIDDVKQIESENSTFFNTLYEQYNSLCPTTQPGSDDTVHYTLPNGGTLTCGYDSDKQLYALNARDIDNIYNNNYSFIISSMIQMFRSTSERSRTAHQSDGKYTYFVYSVPNGAAMRAIYGLGIYNKTEYKYEYTTYTGEGKFDYASRYDENGELTRFCKYDADGYSYDWCYP